MLRNQGLRVFDLLALEIDSVLLDAILSVS